MSELAWNVERIPCDGTYCELSTCRVDRYTMLDTNCCCPVSSIRSVSWKRFETALSMRFLLDLPLVRFLPDVIYVEESVSKHNSFRMKVNSQPAVPAESTLKSL